jgi:carbonic anhydrase
MNRRTLLSGLIGAAALGKLSAQQSSGHPKTEASGMTPDQALSALVEGNQRFVSGHSKHPDQSMARVKELVGTQHPFATVLGCSDSRVDPDIIFDQGLGDLFPVRVAGNIVDDAVLGSIEYAVEHLNCPLVVVLGHEGCGAITAAVNGGEPGTHITFLVDAIMPAVTEAKAQTGDVVSNAVRINALRQAEILRTSKPIVEKAISERKTKVVVAIYDVKTGQVKII